MQELDAAIGLHSLDKRLANQFINGLGFKYLTPVQSAAIPQFLAHRDVAVEACTGSGKTLAYILPVLEMILRRHRAESCQDDDENVNTATFSRRPGYWSALIVSPTRELARQIFNVADPFCSSVGLMPLLLTGGFDVKDDIEKVKENVVDLVIGTPGRLMDLLDREAQYIKWSLFEVLVLDEADVLLDMGFERTVTRILGRLPKQRRTGLFSATQTKEVQALIRAGMRNPAVITVQVHQEAKAKQQKTPTSLHNFYLECSVEEKLGFLCQFIMNKSSEKVIVFFATCASVVFYEKVLIQLMLPQLRKLGREDDCQLLAMHGKLHQKKRMSIYDSFCKVSDGSVLLCTDVMARGVDIPDVDWILQFDAPQDPNFFIHRVGRTSRGGRSGNSLIFLQPKELAYVQFLQQRKVPLNVYDENESDKFRSSGECESILSNLKREVFRDRDLLENGTKAFIAYVRSYKEHKCSFIFKLSNLDLAAVARAFCLLRVPTMSELRLSKGINGFIEAPAEDVVKIPYKDKAKEQQRQKKYLAQQEKIKEDKAKREKLKRQKEKILKSESSTIKKKKKGRHQAMLEEWDALGTEERLYKKMRKGKISKAEYEKLVGHNDLE